MKRTSAMNDLLNDFSIETFKTKHRFSCTHYSFLITWHGKRFYFSGDTEKAETIAEFKDLDWAFVPPWIMVDSNVKKIKIDAKMIAVYHLYPNQEVNNGSPEKIKLLDTQGAIINVAY